MKKFFSLFHFRELRILLSLEIIAILLCIGICNNQNIDIDFSLEAAIASLICWSISSFISPNKYFNFFTMVAVGTFGYGVFWILLRIFGV